ncbi:MAG: prolipoprotein diacylglyceryl transferase [Firmicutes bacterium]|nr:prolipoprotein diacylglyceryl transferase [Bacillota bacterium]
MKILFSIAGFDIYFFGLMTGLGVLAAYWLVQREAGRRDLDAEKVTTVGLYTVLGGIVGARLAFILFYSPGYYLANPLEVFAVHHGGLSIHGGLLGGLLVGGLLVRKHKLPFWRLADIFAPALILAQAVGRIGCDVFGRPTSVPWAMPFGGQLLHPVQIYEFLLNMALFAWLWRRRNSTQLQGQLFLEYFAGFMIIRGIVELFRVNPTVFGFLSVSHLLSIVGLLAVAAVHFLLPRPANLPRSGNGDKLIWWGWLALLVSGPVIYYLVHLVL